MSVSKWSPIVAIAFLSAVSTARAEEKIEQYGPDVTVATAKKIAAGAIKECDANKWPMAIAVVDTHGTLVYYEKMDNTELGSARVALDKAASAALYKRPTRDFFDVTAKSGPYMLTVPGVMAAPGGVPIFSDGKVVGAVAASGGTGAQDEQCAKAGLAGL